MQYIVFMAVCLSSLCIKQPYFYQQLEEWIYGLLQFYKAYFQSCFEIATVFDVAPFLLKFLLNPKVASSSHEGLSKDGCIIDKNISLYSKKSYCCRCRRCRWKWTAEKTKKLTALEIPNLVYRLPFWWRCARCLLQRSETNEGPAGGPP